MTQRAKELFSLFIKIAIAVFAFWFIYVKLVTSNDLKKFISLLKTLPQREIATVLIIVMFLMLVNWGLEAVKWKRLIKPIEPISYWKAIESVFCGLTWAVFTPNRIGEYGGRVFFLSPKRRVVGVVAMAVGGIGQLVITNVLGAIAVSTFIFSFNLLDYRLCLSICAIAAVFCLFFLTFYFNIKWLNGILLSFKFTRKYKKFYAILARYKKVELGKILLLCLARYLVFSTSYFIMFHWLVPGISYIHILMLVSILFFVQSSLPSLNLLDIGIRNITAVYFFKFVTDQNTAVIACITSIWFVNIIIPAILGVYFVFKLNFFGSHRNN
ncbi:MAG: hypothetical protein V4541_03290 [Bacteroidota bacterium]